MTRPLSAPFGLSAPPLYQALFVFSFSKSDACESEQHAVNKASSRGCIACARLMGLLLRLQDFTAVIKMQVQVAEDIFLCTLKCLRSAPLRCTHSPAVLVSAH
jgi:hypothetical protein